MKIRILFIAAVLMLFGCHSYDYDVNMVFVEGGSFVMGDNGGEADADEHPLHRVEIKDFYMGKCEITQKQWMRIMRKNPSCFEDKNYPVECVSWYDVQLFIKRLNDKTGKRYRLPTEAEWEYAAKGGKYGKADAGKRSNGLTGIAWFIENSDSTTHRVGSLLPNELGIYDMTGNVHEWCYDSYDSLSYSRSVGIDMLPHNEIKVFRGGSWYSRQKYCRISNRNHISAETRNFTLGFRLAADAEPEERQHRGR